MDIVTHPAHTKGTGPGLHEISRFIFTPNPARLAEENPQPRKIKTDPLNRTQGSWKAQGRRGEGASGVRLRLTAARLASLVRHMLLLHCSEKSGFCESWGDGGRSHGTEKRIRRLPSSLH